MITNDNQDEARHDISTCQQNPNSNNAGHHRLALDLLHGRCVTNSSREAIDLVSLVTFHLFFDARHNQSFTNSTCLGQDLQEATVLIIVLNLTSHSIHEVVALVEILRQHNPHANVNVRHDRLHFETFGNFVVGAPDVRRVHFSIKWQCADYLPVLVLELNLHNQVVDELRSLSGACDNVCVCMLVHQLPHVPCRRLIACPGSVITTANLLQQFLRRNLCPQSFELLR
eukprot:6027285-Amphidinium_carterae.2